VPIHGSSSTSIARVQPAERQVELGNGPWVRLIRRLLDNDRQEPLITTHPDMSIGQVAGAMFSRRSRENRFGYMREQFNLDHWPGHALDQQDTETRVVDPR